MDSEHGTTHHVLALLVTTCNAILGNGLVFPASVSELLEAGSTGTCTKGDCFTLGTDLPHILAS